MSGERRLTTDRQTRFAYWVDYELRVKKSNDKYNLKQ